jgi:uncharacterized protein YdhG (YjbR/CyaY superfamily)
MTQDKPGTTAKTVDAYLAAIPEGTRGVLEQLREAIRAAAPEAEEAISYQIPTCKYHGVLVHFVAPGNYCSFIIVSKQVIETFRSEPEHFDISGTTIHFSKKNPLPATLVKKIVSAKMTENETKAKK